MNLRGTHPQASALDLLDLVLNRRTGSLADFGVALDPPAPFALLVAEAFDRGMAVQDWQNLMQPGADPKVVAALRQVWVEEVLPKLASRYRLNR